MSQQREKRLGHKEKKIRRKIVVDAVRDRHRRHQTLRRRVAEYNYR